MPLPRLSYELQKHNSNSSTAFLQNKSKPDNLPDNLPSETQLSAILTCKKKKVKDTKYSKLSTEHEHVRSKNLNKPLYY